MTATRRTRPKVIDMAFPIFFVLRVKRAMPANVDNSAMAFIKGPIASPLRKSIARNAMLDVVAPEEKPNNK